MASGNRGDIPILPDGIQLSYLAEGAANIIFRFSLDHPSAVDPNFPPNVDRTHLLRLRKSVASAVKSLPAYVALQNIFYPLFSKELILDTHVIRIPRGLIERENLVLKEQEASGNRPAKRAGLYLIGPPPSDITPDGELEQYEHYGFLVEDMTPAAPSEVGISRREVLVEFKPKWLLPSPTAPQGAKRCRTCALRALKVFQKRGVTIIGNGSPSPGYWCPFDLAGGEPQRVRRAVKSILSQKGTIKTGWKGGISEDERVILENKIVGYFIGPGTKLLGMLKQYQSDWDPRGPMNVFGENGDINTEPVVSGESNSGVWSDQWTEGVKKYLMAMTIRDFSFFLKVDLRVATPSDPIARNESIQARIGDLDLKSPENGKAKYWIDIEKKLIDEGWYAGTEMSHQAGSPSTGDEQGPERVKTGFTGEYRDVNMQWDRDIGDKDVQHRCTTNTNWCTI